MAQSSHAPEVVQAFKLFKEGNRNAAGQLLRQHLETHPHDTDAWWLMAHIVSKPESAAKILRKILTLDPDHAKARAKLAQIAGETDAPPLPESERKPATFERWEPNSGGGAKPAPGLPQADAVDDWSASSGASSWLPDAAVEGLAATDVAGDDDSWLTGGKPGAASPAGGDDEPDDDLFFATSSPSPKRRSSQRASRRASQQRKSTLPVLKPPDAPLTADTGPVIVPLAEPARASDPLPAADTAADPFAFEPTASMVAGVTKPDWPTAEANIARSAPAVPQAAIASPTTFEEFAANMTVEVDPFSGAPLDDPFANLEQLQAALASPGGESIISPERDFDDEDYGRRTLADHAVAFSVAGFTVLVLIAVILFALDNAGSIDWFPDLGYSWDTLETGQFSIDYPDDWNQRCQREVGNYEVCGIANYDYNNHVDAAAQRPVDLSQEAMWFDDSISIIVMDVPTTSPAYGTGGSLAKILWEQSQYYLYGDIKYTGSVKTTINGEEAYTYKFTRETDWWNEAAWDVYIRHGDTMFWMRAYYSGSGPIPDDTLQTMIDSIEVH